MNQITNRNEFRMWLYSNSQCAKECFLNLKRGNPVNDNYFYYIDAVEEALCFGWIDSTVRIIDGKSMQRFSPRRKNSHWTELNKERVRRLEKLGLMTDYGRSVLPNMNEFVVDPDVKKDLSSVWEIFSSFHPLYQRVRLSNLSFHKNSSSYSKMIEITIEKTKQRKYIGQWNDYGRLLNY